MSYGQQDQWVPALQDQTGAIMAYANARGELWGYNERNEWVPMDRNGMPIQQPPMGGYDSYPQQQPPMGGYPQQPQQYGAPAMSQPRLPGGSFSSRSSGSVGQTASGFDRYSRASVNQEPEPRKGGNDRYSRRREPEPEVRVEQPVEVQVVNLNLKGYKPELDSEFIPLHDEEKYEAVLVTDEERKTYKFLINKKEK
jgi:hypothetical protein